jgi:hypothetical protein
MAGIGQFCEFVMGINPGGEAEFLTIGEPGF